MNPNEYYRIKSAEIKEADIRLVATCMSDHVGEENLIRIEALCRRVSMDDRKVRIILEKLTIEYHLPVCAHSGKAGRWLARSYAEAKPTQMEHYSRSNADKRRGDAFNSCHYPPPENIDEIEISQPALFDEPVVRGYRSPWEV
jgi:hypothetical protein